MSTTTADRLALLLRTKQWQRMELEKRYPSLDFDEVPFSAYRQLWMGRAYVRGLVGAWNAYGRSNSDADRDVLYDYSGHGRDIRLYNFDFTESSGYSGGGLVSDGVDDYGQCLKGFALPDDYTVVAVRRMLSEGTINGSGLVSKGHNVGAFLFEGITTTINCFSYGGNNYLPASKMPGVFSYQTKTSYNGNALNVGTAVDDDTRPLLLFKASSSSVSRIQAVLYDLRIYDHSLTAEELQTVRDEMMSDYEKYAKPLDGIHYVADWDAKGRSNEEEEPMRSAWTDKATGKVIDLHNYAYAGMSGWGGYTQDITNWTTQGTDNTIEGNCYVFRTVRHAVNFLWRNPAAGQQRMKVRISGLKKLIDSGELSRIRLYANNISIIYDFFDDGDHDVSFNVPEDTSFLYLYAVNPNIETDIWQPLSSPVIAELLPLYPGALESDGVDDYGVTRDAISEEVGTMLVYGRLIDESAGGYYILNTNNSSGDNGRLYVWRSANGNYNFGLPNKSGDKPPFVLTRVPQAPALPMYIASSSPGYYSACFIQRLILIREQLDDAQTDFLKWKVEKEYRDWCKANGYEYAINQLTA